MYIIAGLGNPEKKYEQTRHNAGFRVIDNIAQSHNISFAKQQLKAAVGSGFIGTEKVLLVKPLTYMNLSGESIRPLCDYYKVDPEKELIVISDDTDLDVGMIRLRGQGSAGGHNGLKSIIAHLGTDAFMRVRVGVGHRSNDGDQIDHVLGLVPPEERQLLEESEERAALAVCAVITDGMARAMNIFNTKKQKKEESTVASKNIGELKEGL